MPAVSTAKSKRPAARKPALPNALAEAAWVEADRALAQALALFDELDAGKDNEVAALLGQALTQAGRRRGFERLGSVGAVETFNPDRHELAKAAAKAPLQARILVRGVSRGVNVLVKARVAPASAKRARPTDPT
jgi:hypothetical protein